MHAGDPAREEQDCSLVGVEVPIVAELALELKDHEAGHVCVPLIEVAPQPRLGREGRDAISLDPGDPPAAIAGRAAVLPLDATAARRAAWVRGALLKAGETAMTDAP